jgi:hypothetical protein
MRPVYRAILSVCTALVNVGLTTSGYTNFYLACVLWAIAAALALSIAVPWLAGMWLTPISATNEQPQKMDQASSSAPSQVVPALEVDRDVWLRDAMWRAFLRTWHVPEGAIPALGIKEPETQRFVMLIIDEFRQSALEGKLPIWGRRKGSFIWELVPRDFWTCNHIDHIPVARADPPEEVKARAEKLGAEPDTSADWRHFMTSKAEVEKLYPSPQ